MHVMTLARTPISSRFVGTPILELAVLVGVDSVVTWAAINCTLGQPGTRLCGDEKVGKAGSAAVRVAPLGPPQ